MTGSPMNVHSRITWAMPARVAWVASALSLFTACGDGARAPWDLTATGVGGISFGSSVADVEEELGVPLDPALLEPSCSFVHPSGAPEGLTLMVENGRIVRAD